MKKLNVSIFVKIWLSVSVLFLGYIISMIMIQSTGGKLKSGLNTISGSLFPAATISQQALANFEDQLKFYQDAVMMGEISLVDKATESSEQVQVHLQKIMALKDLDKNRRNELQEINQSLASFTRASKDIYKKMAEGDMSANIIQKATAQSKIKDALLKSIQDMAENLSQDSKDKITSIVDYYSSQQTFNLILFFIVLSVSVVIVWLVTKRSIVAPVTNVINQLKTVAPEIDASSTQIAESSHALAEGSSEQAASIEETSSSLEEMSSMTRQNADHATKANNLMQQTSGVIDKANASMGELTASMNKISEASEETSKIIKTIDEIAFQTNLLALNAAVEAARAGEAGAGFAVVADEVRNLAMRAAEAAKNTSVLIEDTVKRIKDGTLMVSQTNDAFSEVSQSSITIKDLVEEIAAASNEQAQGIEQINKAVTEMDKVVQQNASSAEESASASQEMNTQVDKLNEVVTDLVSVIGGRVTMQKKRPSALVTPVQKPSHWKENNAVKAVAPVKKKTTISPEEVIPIEDSDIMDF